MKANPVQSAATYFQEQRQSILENRSDEPCRPEIFSQTLRTYLQHAASERSYPVNELVELAPEFEVTCDDRRPGKDLIHELEHLELKLQRQEVDEVIFMRDKRKPLDDAEGMPETYKALASFQQHGGRYLELEFDWLADFYALDRLRTAAYKGELSYIDDTGNSQPVTIDHVREFMCGEFQSGLIQRLIDLFRKQDEPAQSH